MLAYVLSAVIIALYWVLRSPLRTAKSVCVVVLGDFGRSPRMQYHALSLSELGDVDVVAYAGSKPLQSIVDNDLIRLSLIYPPPALPKSAPRWCFLLYAPLKVVFQTVQLILVLLFRLPKPSHVLVQNPPSIPTFPVVWAVCRLRGSRFVVDWHNYGYTILGLALGDVHWVVKIAKRIEEVFGRRSDDSMCVTAAMKADLAQNWGVAGAKVLHDRPPPMFAPVPVAERPALFRRLAPDAQGAFGLAADGATVFSASGGGLRPDRPALLVSSTSWTPDEDFGILLSALEGYEKRCGSNPLLPDVVCVITGKGPLKAFYEKKVAEMTFKHVRIATMWLAIEDYPLLLGAADVGVCLHTSSSGLDLPMKVVDMFGCGLPVCAVNFGCLDELVQHEKNGLVFESGAPAQLTGHLERLLGGFPAKQPDLAKFRANLAGFRENGWGTNWDRHAKPVFA